MPSRRSRRRCHPALQSLLDILAANSAEPCVVIVRPSGEKTRQCRLYIPSCARDLLRRALEVIDEEGLGDEVDEVANPRAGGRGQSGGGEGEDDEEDGEDDEGEGEEASTGGDVARSRGPTHLESRILDALTAARKSLYANAIWHRLGRKGRPSGGFRKALQRLVERGEVQQGPDEAYRATVDMGDSGAGPTEVNG